jgi:nucleoid-associated protein YgaU
MPNEDLSHLPPDVQASIKAAREKAEKEKAEKARAERVQARKARVEGAQAKKRDQGLSHLPPDVQASIKAAREKAEQEKIEKEKAEQDKGKTYVVQSGDSLSKIAKALLGDAARWPEIFELNKDQIKDPNLIYPGQELRLP